ncbi:MAG: SnoaL-like domain-containing protein [Bacteroidota bacterium]
MSYLDKIKELYGMIGTGQMMEGFEKFYHEDVEMIEGTGESCKGKDANRAREQEFMGSIQEMHGGGAGAICSNEEDGVTSVESWMDVTFKDGNRVKMEQVAVQHWEEDHIIKERFYYNVPG